MLAFAGSGNISLKEALDAAHGHEHNEDGSEMTAEDKARKKAEAAEGHEHDGGHGGAGALTYGLGVNRSSQRSKFLTSTISARSTQSPKCPRIRSVG